MTGTDNRLLDQIWRIFGDLKALDCRGQQRHAAGLTKLQRGAWIIVDERFLNRRFARIEAANDAGQPIKYLAQSIGENFVGLGTHEARSDVRESYAVTFDDAPAGAAQARIYADDAGDVGHVTGLADSGVACRT